MHTHFPAWYIGFWGSQLCWNASNQYPVVYYLYLCSPNPSSIGFWWQNTYICINHVMILFFYLICYSYFYIVNNNLMILLLSAPIFPFLSFGRGVFLIWVLPIGKLIPKYSWTCLSIYLCMATIYRWRVYGVGRISGSITRTYASFESKFV